jgi:hypothetical protein
MQASWYIFCSRSFTFFVVHDFAGTTRACDTKDDKFELCQLLPGYEKVRIFESDDPVHVEEL